MAKRFTATTKWADPWFQDLEPELKCAWLYLLDNCDSAGVWVVNLKLLNFQIGKRLEWEHIRRAFQGRIQEFDNDKIWVPKFLDFQYGQLLPSCKPHASVISTLKKHGLWEDYLKGIETLSKGYPKGIDTLKEKEKDQDQEKDLEDGGVGEETKPRPPSPPPRPKTTEIVSAQKAAFEAARKAYPGTKRGEGTEWQNFERKWGKEAGTIIPCLMTAIESQKAEKEARKAENAWVAEWKHFDAWINGRCWERIPGEMVVAGNGRATASSVVAPEAPWLL